MKINQITKSLLIGYILITLNTDSMAKRQWVVNVNQFIVKTLKNKVQLTKTRISMIINVCKFIDLVHLITLFILILLLIVGKSVMYWSLNILT